MNYDQYMSVIHRTKADTIHPDVVSSDTLEDIINHRLLGNVHMDAAKKGLFYGRTSELLKEPDAGTPAEHLEGAMDLVHAIVGIDTESAELLTMLRDSVFREGQAPSRDEIADEAGDLFWYFTLLLKATGITLQEVMERNYKKLSTRFPDGTFSLDQWESRDKENEKNNMIDTMG
ncbi:MazG nucleotide pyrophosphohydrolase domain-containing protein [Nitratireductor aquimarinus]|uniref:MazG nucleotide pyrophosphohydrolase domain-containing protein n=1 Tax=Nitratireductor aquimarinus TaxID=889300 RepID=UPI002936C71E|nr:MazG nucleotide pyrophosphohydrolase domain-containing protein [Nitratireductor aquimarinus]MDV2965562.1 MazG nucleotide pyrophosphohydrolase domain-containing protein [Nitratireductor aquimarinus]